MVAVVDADGWTEALLAPPDPAVASDRPIADHELVALLVGGRFDEAENRLEVGPTVGLHGLTGGFHPDLPVSSALTQWLLTGPGLLQGSMDALLILARDDDRGRRFAGTVLAAVALSNREQLEKAVDLLAAAEGDFQGSSAGLLALQHGCRLAELGDRDHAVSVLYKLRDSMQTVKATRGQDLARVAGAVLLNLRIDAEDLWDELHSNPPGAALEERTRRRVNGLAEAANLTLAALTAGTGPGIRSSRWGPGLLGLLGAWLRAECWADYGAIRRSRAELAAHALTQHLLPVPANWDAARADRVDLDLARRSGDDRLTERGYRVLWDEGPVEELQSALAGLAAVPWRPDRELATLKALSASGDLLAERAAGTVIDRLIALVDDDADRHFVPEFYVAPALAATLPAAPDHSHTRVAHLVAELPLDHRILRPFAVIPGALDVTALGADTQALLQAWAASALASTPGTLAVGIEVLLTLARDPERVGPVRDVLLHSFRTRPSLRVALGILLSSDEEEPAVTGYLLERVADPRDDPRDGGLDPAVLLAVVAARRPHLMPRLTDFVARDDIGLLDKRWVLGQLAIGPPTVAQGVLTLPPLPCSVAKARREETCARTTRSRSTARCSRHLRARDASRPRRCCARWPCALAASPTNAAPRRRSSDLRQR